MTIPRIVLTGGPGAGKTAVLEVIRRGFGPRVAVLPEAASILFSGGFPRGKSAGSRRAAQRAIFRVIEQLERLACEEPPPGVEVILCDRGTIDGLAYWPGPPAELLDELGTTLEHELARYEAVIHLRVPTTENGYNNRDNPHRIEGADEARMIDARILEVWRTHPDRVVIEESVHFLDKVEAVVHALRARLPDRERAEPQ